MSMSDRLESHEIDRILDSKQIKREKGCSPLNPDVIQCILLKLPARDLGRCACVCQTWRALIISPPFISIHLGIISSSKSNNATHAPLLLFRCMNRTRNRIAEQYGLYFDNGVYPALCKQLDFPFCPRTCNFSFSFGGCCHGLVCLAADEKADLDTFILWNPVIRKALRVPTPNVAANLDPTFAGFGYDSQTHDFKLLRFVDFGARFEVEMYSLNANSLRTITDLAPQCRLGLASSDDDKPYHNTFVAGAIHLLVVDGAGSCILAFDVRQETFNPIPLPPCFYNDVHLQTQLVKFGDSIALLRQYKTNRLDLWVRQDGAWTRVMDCNSDNKVLPRVLVFRKNRHAIVETSQGILKTLDIRASAQSFTLEVRSREGSPIVDNFVETLALLDKGQPASAALWDVSDEDLKYFCDDD